MSHKPLWIHQYLYFHNMWKKIVDTQQKFSAEAWNNIQSASFKISKMVQVTNSNSYFLKMKTFRFHTMKLLRNRTKAYILDVICHIFYFLEFQYVVLGQFNGQDILAPRTENHCIGIIVLENYFIVKVNLFIDHVFKFFLFEHNPNTDDVRVEMEKKLEKKI